MSALGDDVIDAVFVGAFTTAGLVAGRCGHRHETVADAFQCVRAYAFEEGCQFHDRHVYALTDDGELCLLDRDQARELARCFAHDPGFLDAIDDLEGA